MNNKAFPNKVWLSTPTMHGEELEYIKQAYETNWMSTIGANIDAIEESIATFIGTPYAVALSSGTAAIHMAIKLAGVQAGDTVFCSDTTFAATVNPVLYEGATPVFIDSEYQSWNMDPEALELAFSIYPKTKVVIVVNLYGSPAQLKKIQLICQKYNAILIEDAAESMGATLDGKQTGSFGDYNILSFNGNKIITGSSGGMLLCHDRKSYEKVKKWSTQSREAAPWYQHEEVGYNYRMSNVIAGIVRGQFLHLEEHIDKKKKIYEKYSVGFKGLPLSMNPILPNANPNYWLSCLLIDKEAMQKQVRSDNQVLYATGAGKSTPSEILDKLQAINAEGRPIWKPMHMQPLFRLHPYITKSGSGRASSNAYIEQEQPSNVGLDLFERGLCLPSDIKMTELEQDIIIDNIRKCFE